MIAELARTAVSCRRKCGASFALAWSIAGQSACVSSFMRASVARRVGQRPHETFARHGKSLYVWTVRKCKEAALADRPSYWLRPALERIGRKWRALYGENPQDGVAAFGDTPDEAFADFDKKWFTHRGPSGFRGHAKG